MQGARNLSLGMYGDMRKGELICESKALLCLLRYMRARYDKLLSSTQGIADPFLQQIYCWFGRGPGRRCQAC